MLEQYYCFLTDLDKIDELIRSTFEVMSPEDTADRLGEAQFGYQSLHYTIKVPLIWLEIPTMADFGDIQAEVQVRTLAQHIWAAASHKLQYKNEASVPPPNPKSHQSSIRAFRNYRLRVRKNTGKAERI